MKMKNRWKASLVFVILVLSMILFAVILRGYWKEQNKEFEMVSDNVLAPYTGGVLSIDDDGITIYWKKPENVTAYQIYRSYEEEEGYELIAEFEEDASEEEFIATGFYVDSDFDYSKSVVYYRIRTYVMEDNRRIYSPYTKTITAKYKENLQLECSTIALPVGEERQLHAYYGWGNAENVTWNSLDTSIVDVDENGIIHAKASGETIITCSKAGGESAQISVAVDREESEELDCDYTIRYVKDESDGVWKQMDGIGTSGEAVIMMAGDLMCMGGQQRVLHTDEGGYNFNESFDYVKNILSASDLAIGNLETMIASDRSYSSEEVRIDGMPNCNAPARYLDAVRYAGFDALVMANNHNCDAYQDGVSKTIEQVDRYGFGHTGLFGSESEDRVLLYEVNGIKVGILAYVGAGCHFNGRDGTWKEEEKDLMLNRYSFEKAEREINELKEAGADYIIIYMHWGVTDHFDLKSLQIECAQELADLGADYITGAHPHIIQEYDEITASDGRIVPCAYSIGDFNGYVNQVAGNLDSVLLRIKLEKQEDGSVMLTENGYISVYNYKEYNESNYVTVPISAAMNGGYELEEEYEIRERIADAIGDKISEILILP